MRVDLALQRVKPGLKQKALLLFQLHLYACEVPDFDWDGNSCNRGGNDRQQGYWTVDGKGPNLFWRSVLQEKARSLQRNNHQEECGLPIDAWMTQIALYPAVHAEVDERRERPNFFFIAAEVAQ